MNTKPRANHFSLSNIQRKPQTKQFTDQMIKHAHASPLIFLPILLYIQNPPENHILKNDTLLDPIPHPKNTPSLIYTKMGYLYYTNVG